MLNPAYLHPIAMLLILALGIFVLRDGVAIRRARLLQRPIDSRRHRRLGRALVLGAVLGFAAGLYSMAALREKPLAESVHFPFALLAVIGLTSAAFFGWRLEQGARLSIRKAHATLAALGILFALGAAVAGLAILP